MMYKRGGNQPPYELCASENSRPEKNLKICTRYQNIFSLCLSPAKTVGGRYKYKGPPPRAPTESHPFQISDPIPSPNASTTVNDIPSRFGVTLSKTQEAIPERLHHEQLLQARVHIAGVAQVSQSHAANCAPLPRARTVTPAKTQWQRQR